MTQLSRWLVRYELVRTAAAWLALALVVVLAAFVFAAFYAGPALASVAAALGLVAVAGSGLLYASRPGTGGPGD